MSDANTLIEWKQPDYVSTKKYIGTMAYISGCRRIWRLCSGCEKLNKSQSSLNHAVAKLQQTLRCLAGSQGRKAFLTDEGHVFLRRAKQLTLQMEELELLAYNIHQGWEAEIRLAIELVHPRHLLNQRLQLITPNPAAHSYSSWTQY